MSGGYVAPNQDSPSPPDGSGGGAGGAGSGAGAASAQHMARASIAQVLIEFNCVRVGNAPFQCPAYQVPPGAVVEVFPNRANGSAAFYSLYGPDAVFAGGPRVQLSATDVAVQLAIYNTNQIWGYATNAGDGFTVRVRKF